MPWNFKGYPLKNHNTNCGRMPVKRCLQPHCPHILLHVVSNSKLKFNMPESFLLTIKVKLTKPVYSNPQSTYLLFYCRGLTMFW